MLHLGLQGSSSLNACGAGCAAEERSALNKLLVALERLLSRNLELLGLRWNALCIECRRDFKWRTGPVGT